MKKRERSSYDSTIYVNFENNKILERLSIGDLDVFMQAKKHVN